ncbi:hypothetical protein CXF83_18360 [Shewanella sp. Choline-02u-19]|nr:hypothetical protein CXF84_19565 [Shewanella sp. Bg11-22]PKI28529.1 hypothetical protein CXF83_18360 [Shewanella sp. Choline-02u-19]
MASSNAVKHKDVNQYRTPMTAVFSISFIMMKCLAECRSPITLQCKNIIDNKKAADLATLD